MLLAREARADGAHRALDGAHEALQEDCHDDLRPKPYPRQHGTGMRRGEREEVEGDYRPRWNSKGGERVGRWGGTLRRAMETSMMYVTKNKATPICARAARARLRASGQGA